MKLQKIIPHLWFDDQAEEAAILKMKKIKIKDLQEAYDH